MWSDIKDDENGVWMGCLRDDEANGGLYGLWLIGNQEAMRGTPAYAKSILYKSWHAHVDKYSGQGHCVNSGPHEDRHESVVTMTGRLECHVNGAVRKQVFPRSINLAPTQARLWKLPEAASRRKRARIRVPTYGFTVCRHLRRDLRERTAINPHVESGLEIHPFSFAYKDGIPACLQRPDKLKEWSYQFVGVFIGRLNCYPIEAESSWYYFLPARCHMYLPQGLKKEWSTYVGASEIRGVTIYY